VIQGPLQCQSMTTHAVQLVVPAMPLELSAEHTPFGCLQNGTMRLMKVREGRKFDKLAPGRPASLQKSKISADDPSSITSSDSDSTRHRG